MYRRLHCTPRYRRLSYYVFASLVTQLVTFRFYQLSCQISCQRGCKWSGYESTLRTFSLSMTDEIGLGMN